MMQKKNLKAAIEKNDLDEIRTKKDALTEIVQNLSVKLYEEAAKQAQAAQRCRRQETKVKTIMLLMLNLKK